LENDVPRSQAGEFLPARVVSLIIPTRNEAPNIEPLIRRLSAVFADSAPVLDIVFVDDSDDATPAAIAAEQSSNPDIRLIHRSRGQRPGGLGGAVKAGLASARGQTIVVMDADLQHPPEVVPHLVQPVLDGTAQLSVGTRFESDGDLGGLSGGVRVMASKAGRAATHAALPRSRSVSDPLSGLFALNRSVIDGVNLQPDGFKILLEIIVKGRWASCVNHPYSFAKREAGDSKASLGQGLRFGRHLAHLLWAPHLPHLPHLAIPTHSPVPASPADLTW
jgi:glycosyltransferase involved in cell wall biosynthesis